MILTCFKPQISCQLCVPVVPKKKSLKERLVCPSITTNFCSRIRPVQIGWKNFLKSDANRLVYLFFLSALCSVFIHTVNIRRILCLFCEWKDALLLYLSSVDRVHSQKQEQQRRMRIKAYHLMKQICYQIPLVLQRDNSLVFGIQTTSHHPFFSSFACLGADVSFILAGGMLHSTSQVRIGSSARRGRE